MGWLDGLFGGGGDSKEQQYDPYQAIGLTTNEQQDLYKKLYEKLNTGLSSGVTPYTGQGVAGLSSNQQAALDRMKALSLEPENPLYGQAQTTLAGLLEGKPTTEINPQVSADYYRKAIYEPQLRTFQNEYLPYLEEEYNKTNTFMGTPRELARERAIRDFYQNQAAQEATITYADEQARRDLLEKAANRSLLASGESVTLANERRDNTIKNALLQKTVGDVQQQLEQANLDWNYSQWLRTQPELSPYLSMVSDFIGLQNETGSKYLTTMANKSSGNPLTDLLGTVLGGGAGSAKGGDGGMVNTDSWGNVFSGKGSAQDWVNAGMDVAKIVAMMG